MKAFRVISLVISMSFFIIACGSKSSDDNDYNRDCSWTASTSDECSCIAVENSCVDWTYNAASFACKGKTCLKEKECKAPERCYE